MKHFFNLCLVFLFIFTMPSCGQQQHKDTAMSQFEIKKTDQEWKQQLNDEQYYVLREKGTERPYTGKFLLHKEKGNYSCGACGNILFESNAKFDSHCGWPSFDKQISKKAIVTKEDNSHGMKRLEIMCGKCGGHLGHVFDDGPTSTGVRYCVNSLSLGFEPEKKEEATVTHSKDTITLAGGCFWCIEAVFQQLNGVLQVQSGYSGGSAETATYKQVCNGNTAHAECVQITFDKTIVSLTEILKVFFTVHNPTTLNQQGADKGPQYRSAIFYKNEEQKNMATEIITSLEKEKVYDNPIVTTLEPFTTFYKAEDYHNNYYNDNKQQPYCQLVIQPKIEKFEKVFKALLKK